MDLLPPPPAVGFDGGPGEWPGDPRELVSLQAGMMRVQIWRTT